MEIPFIPLIIHSKYWASIKPGTRNIPEHAGTSRNIKKIKRIFMKKKKIKKKIIKIK